MLGNLVSRVTKFARAKFGETIPEGGEYGRREAQLISDLTERLRSYESLMAQMEVRKSAAELRAIWVLGNEYLQSAAPWTVVKTDPVQAGAMVRLAMNLIRMFAVTSAPFIPDAAAAMMAAMQSTDWSWPDDVGAALATLPAGHAFTVPENLFGKITDEDRADWQTRFSGTRI